MLSSLDPVLIIEGEIEQLSLSSDTSGIEFEFDPINQIEDFSYNFVFDLNDEIALRAKSEQGGRFWENFGGGEISDNSLGSASAEIGLTLWEGFVIDMANAIADTLIMSEQISQFEPISRTQRPSAPP